MDDGTLPGDPRTPGRTGRNPGGREIPRSIRWRLFLRSLSIQGSWNYRTLLGTGAAFVLLPLLRWLHGGEGDALDEAVGRHAGLFNAHPYLAGIALGAVARMEAQGAPPEMVERFKAAVRGPLGSLGDRLVWAGWLPACLLAALVSWFLGAPYWVVVTGFVVVYNGGHFALRIWGFRVGLREGRGVGERLRDTALPRIGDVLGRVCVLLAGILVPLLVARGPALDGPGAGVPLPWIVAAVVAGAAGLWRGERVKSGAVTAVVVAAVGFLMIGWIE